MTDLDRVAGPLRHGRRRHADRTGWVGAGDGLLALDRNSDGIINDISEISFIGDLEGREPISRGSRVRQQSRRPAVTPPMREYGDFRVWIDANHDGVTDAGELKRLPEVGVLSIDLGGKPTGNPTVSGGTSSTISRASPGATTAPASLATSASPSSAPRAARSRIPATTRRRPSNIGSTGVPSAMPSRRQGRPDLTSQARASEGVIDPLVGGVESTADPDVPRRHDGPGRGDRARSRRRRRRAAPSARKPSPVRHER